VLLLGCGGVLGLTGVGAVFFGAHQETTQGEKTAPATKNGSGKKSQKGRKKGATQKKGGKPAGKKKSSGTKRKSGGNPSGKRR
jgi:hypothetical protein